MRPGVGDERRVASSNCSVSASSSVTSASWLSGSTVEDVEADALGLARLVQQTVALGLRERRRHGLRRERLQLELHGDLRDVGYACGTSATAWRPDRRTRSTTRSFSGMMALSVIVMSSGTDLGAALGDVAVADAVRVLQVADAILGVERVHLERRGVDQEARADELVVHLVVAQHVADVLAQEALDALPEFLHAIDVRLRHPPGAVRRVGRPRLERLDRLLHLEVPRDVGDQVLDRAETRASARR